MPGQAPASAVPSGRCGHSTGSGRQEGVLRHRLPWPDESPQGLASWRVMPVSRGWSGQRKDLGTLLAPGTGDRQGLL